MIGIHSDNRVQCSQTDDVWQLKRHGRTLAVIERSWDDIRWLVFLADDDGELVCAGAHRHLASLKACLRIWARRETSHSPKFFRQFTDFGDVEICERDSAF